LRVPDSTQIVSRMRPRLGFLILLPLAALLAACGREETKLPRVRLSTTTSARDSGLLEYLKPEIRRVAKVELFDVAVGTGLALDQGKKGDADLVIVHDREREDAYVADGWGIERRDLMWNDFVLLGPAEDPAKIRGTTHAAAALTSIAEAGSTFISRGDSSGTHSREKSLWASAGGRPAWPGYLEAGQGQGPTLLLAHEKRAYALSDRGTYASMRARVELVIVVEGDPPLVNQYGAMLINPEKVKGTNVAGARAVLEYLISPEGQARIGAFRKHGEQLFHPGRAE
jgi:tungstate transport system substrate-binding protein